MDRYLAVTQRLARSGGKHTLNLGDDCERNFLRGFRAKVKPGRRKESGVDRQAQIQKVAQQLIASFARSDQTDIMQVEWQQCSQDCEIPSVIVRLYDHSCPFIRFEWQLICIDNLECLPA